MRLLRHNKSTRAPSNFLWVDTESHPPEPTGKPGQDRLRFRLGCATWSRIEQGQCKGRRDLDFQDSAEFFALMYDRMTPKRPLWVIAHRANFDWTLLGGWAEGESGRLKLVSDVISSKIWYLIYENERGKCYVVDSCNWWKSTIGELGRGMGLDKLAMPPWDNPLEQWFRYCRRDTEIVRQATIDLLGLVSALDAGNWRLTVAGQAMSLYRHRTGPTATVRQWKPAGPGEIRAVESECLLPIPHPLKAIHELERAAYHGGPVHCFWRGKVTAAGGRPQKIGQGGKWKSTDSRLSPLFKLDGNSAYPDVMRGNPYPSRFVSYEDNIEHAKLATLLGDYLAVALVDIETHTHRFPFLLDGTLCFPLGRYTTALCTPELRVALSSGLVRRVWRAAFYDSADLFTRHVDSLYPLKCQAKKAGRLAEANLYKDLLNSLYGKFGQREHEYHILPDAICPRRWGWGAIHDWESGETVQCCYRDGVMHIASPRGETDTSCPVVSAHVTSYARVRQWELIAIAGDRNVIYSAVDGLVVTREGYDHLVAAGEVDPWALGKLRLEGTETEAEFRGVSNWDWGSQRRIAGVPCTAPMIDSRHVRRTVWQTAESTVQSRPEETITRDTQEVSIYPVYRHGHAGADGWTTPYRLPLDGAAAIAPTLEPVGKQRSFIELVPNGPGSVIAAEDGREVRPVRKSNFGGSL